MEILFVLNLAVATVLLFWPVWFSRTQLRLPWVNPFTILLVLSLPVSLMKLFGGPLILIENGLFSPGFQYAVLMTNLQTLAQTAGLVCFYRLFGAMRVDRQLPLRRVVLRPRDLRRAARVFLWIYLLCLYLLASAEFGVANWIANPREGYQLYRTGQGHWYALSATALSVSFLLSFLARPLPWAVLRSTVFHLVLSYFLGSKGVMLSFFGAALVFLWFLRWRHLTRLLVLGSPLLFGALIFNLFLALSDGFALQSILEYFDYYKNAADYYMGYLSHEIPLFYGEVAWGSLWSYVPRALWPDKPVVYGVLMINEIFYPGQAELTNTPAFGGAVEQFADFGWPGVLLFGFFSVQSVATALMSYFIFRRPGLHLPNVTLATVLVLLVQYAPAFGTFFPGLLYLLLLAVVLGVVRMLRRPRRQRRAPGTGGTALLTALPSGGANSP